jgi:hypothetical protein
MMKLFKFVDEINYMYKMYVDDEDVEIIKLYWFIY